MKLDVPVKLERFKSFPVIPNGKQAWGGFGWRLTGRNKSIDEWREIYPDCNVGIETGLFNGIFVIDVDIPDLELPMLNHTFTVKTPRGGRHHYYRLPEELFDASKMVGLYLGVDFMCNGGYVVAPPSHIVDDEIDGRYEVLIDAPIVAPSEELLVWIKNSPKFKRDQKYLHELDDRAQKNYARKTEFFLLNAIRKSVEGVRNKTLIQSSYKFGQLQHLMPKSQNELYELIFAAYEEVDSDTPHETVYKQIDAAYREGLENPRKPVTPEQIAYMANEAKQLLTNKRTRLTDELLLDYFGYRVLESGITSPLLPVRDVALAIGKSHMTVSRSIERLVEMKVLELNGSRKEFLEAQSYRLGEKVFLKVLHNPQEESRTYKDYVTVREKLYPFYGRVTDVDDPWTYYEFGESARRIYEFLANNHQDGPFTPKQIIQSTSISQPTVYRKLNQMLDVEIIGKIDKAYYVTGVKPEATGRGWKRSVKMESRYEMERNQYKRMLEAKRKEQVD